MEVVLHAKDVKCPYIVAWQAWSSLLYVDKKLAVFSWQTSDSRRSVVVHHEGSKEGKFVTELNL